MKGPPEAIQQAFNRWIERSCADPDRTFFDPNEFAWVAACEARWEDIRAELDALLARQEQIPAFHEVSPREAFLSDNRWKTFFFRVYGNDIAEARRLCPVTASVIDQAPSWTTAFFSILDAKRHIAPHHGPYKGILRYHLGLLIPAGGECNIRVGNDVRSWREGGSLIFDDTHDHEVRNDAPSQRVVLFVDFVRPLPGLVGLVNRAVLSVLKHVHPDVVEARRNARAYGATMLDQA